jgi:hypothetical protein
MEQDIKKEDQKSSEDKKKSSSFAIIFLIISAILAWFVYGGGIKKQTFINVNMDNAYQKVSDDAVAQYNIAKAQGDKIQICVQAGLVSAAYLQAQNQSSYNNWKDIQRMDCERAGIPQ